MPAVAPLPASQRGSSFAPVFSPDAGCIALRCNMPRNESKHRFIDLRLKVGDCIFLSQNPALPLLGGQGHQRLTSRGSLSIHRRQISFALGRRGLWVTRKVIVPDQLWLGGGGCLDFLLIAILSGDVAEGLARASEIGIIGRNRENQATETPTIKRLTTV